MALRSVDADVYVSEGGQFIISLARSGRRGFLAPDGVAEWYVTRYGQIKMLTVVLLAASSAGAALKLFSPIWIATSIAVPIVSLRWLELVVAFVLLLIVALQFALGRRAHAARQYDRPSSAVTR